MAPDKQYNPGTEVEEDVFSTYLTFDVGEQTLGVEVRHVQEILDMRRITRLPNAPADVQGVVDVRDASIPVLDLKSRLGIPSIESGPDARIVVVEIATGDRRKPLGILADRVRNVDRIPVAEIQPCPSTGVGHWNSSILQGLSRRGSELVVLIRLDRIFGDAADELEPDEAAGLF
ncbi:chemotaxis protein CheW [uncultured Jannaschia sp.]|uniref:chemotaxis protein CheW n=1 Tax=uncultured Jannaschia sp. TaxID=293347 RepID=UPI002630C307|nr:chemotaxis protein CheW [uncultured Jannaschia sp.]